METERDTRTPMGEQELDHLLVYMKTSFKEGETDQQIVEDLFGSYGVWREDLVALIRKMVKDKMEN